MSMQKNIIVLAIIGLFSALVSWLISSVFIQTDIEEVKYNRIKVDIPDTFPALDEAHFNKDSIDTFRATKIGE